MKKGCWIALIALLLAAASVGALGLVIWSTGGQQTALLMRAKLARGQQVADLYRELVALRGPDPELYLWMGEALADADQHAQAIEAWEQAAQLDPEEPEPLLRIAELSLDEDDLRAAEDAVQRALDRAPDSWRAHSISGMVAGQRGDHALAVHLLEQALDLGGPENEVCYPLGQAWEELGDTDAAVEAYERGGESCDGRCRKRLRELRGEAPEPAEAGASADERNADNEREENDMEPFAGVLFGFFFLAYFGFIALIIAVSWGGYIAAALAIYDCSQRDFPSPQTRGAWCLLLFIGQWLGAIIYYFAIYRPDTPRRIAPGVRS